MSKNGKKGKVETNYSYTYDPTHPFKNKDGFVREHRVMMENWLRVHDPKNINLIEIEGKLYLRQESVVHHINRLKYDNRIENLKVFEKQGLHTANHNSERSQSDIQRKKNDTIKHTHPLISLGKSKLGLLRYMSHNGKERLNIKRYSREISVPRSTVYYMLQILQKEKMVEKQGLGYFIVTEYGKSYVESTLGDSGGVTSQRRECRGSQENLSTHYIKYRLPISDKINFNPERLKEIGPNRVHKVKWNNDFIYYAYFDDVTVIINPHVVLIRIHDIVVKDTEEAQFETLNKAIVYSSKLKKIGLISESIELDRPHYERIDSLLADFLKKIDNRYYLELEDGTKFWIDCSGGTTNDETDDETARKNIDEFMSKIMNGKINFDDLKEIKEIAGMMVTLEAMKMREALKPKEEVKPEDKPTYFG